MTPAGDDPRWELENLPAHRFLDALDALGFGVALLDAELRFADISGRLGELLGRSADEMRALADPAVIVTPERRHMVADRRAAMALGEGGPALDEAVLVHTSGERIPVEFASTAVPLPDGGEGLLAICRDLRQTRAHEAALERFASLLELMPLGLIFWDASDVVEPSQLRLAGANLGAEQMLGLDSRRAVGQTLEELFPEVDPNHAARLLALAGTDRVEHFANVAFAGGGTPRVFRWQAAGLSGPAVGVFFEDVTDERSAEIERRHLLERLVDTGDDERRRLAGAMHDDPVQKIAAATLLVEALRRHPGSSDQDARLEAVQSTLRSAMSVMRRLTFELSPPELAESGLEAAVRSAAEFIFEGSATQAVVRVDLGREPSAAVQTAAFRIVAEALTNTRKHASASASHVTVSDREGPLLVEIVDDGDGFDLQEADRLGHIGLRTMQERASTLGGTCRIATGPGGVTVTAELPLDGREALVVDLPPVFAAAARSEDDWETLQLERQSLEHAIKSALERAAVAEGRLRDAFGLTKAMLVPGLSEVEIVTAAAKQLSVAMRDGCAVHRFDEQGIPRLVAAWHSIPAQLGHLCAGLFDVTLPHGGHVGTVRRSGEAVVLDRDALQRLSVDPAKAGPYSPESAIVAPLAVDGVALGTVTVVRDVTRVPYSSDDLEFFLCLVDRVAIALVGESSADPV